MFSKHFRSGWISLVQNPSLLKYFDITLPRHKSSKIEGSGPPLMSHAIQLHCVCFRFSTVSKGKPFTQDVISKKGNWKNLMSVWRRRLGQHYCSSSLISYRYFQLLKRVVTVIYLVQIEPKNGFETEKVNRKCVYKPFMSSRDAQVVQILP